MFKSINFVHIDTCKVVMSQYNTSERLEDTIRVIEGANLTHNLCARETASSQILLSQTPRGAPIKAIGDFPTRRESPEITTILVV